METHVKALAALQIALSALSLLFAIVLMLIFGGVMGPSRRPTILTPWSRCP